MKRTHIGSIQQGIDGYDAFYLCQSDDEDEVQITRNHVYTTIEKEMPIGSSVGSAFVQDIHVYLGRHDDSYVAQISIRKDI